VVVSDGTLAEGRVKNNKTRLLTRPSLIDLSCTNRNQTSYFWPATQHTVHLDQATISIPNCQRRYSHPRCSNVITMLIRTSSFLQLHCPHMLFRIHLQSACIRNATYSPCVLHAGFAFIRQLSGKLFTHMICPCHQAIQSGTSQRALMLFY